LTPHDLRHTAASLAISAGANVQAVQRMLGHASAAMTLDVYAELFEDDLDEVAAGLDAQAVRRTPATGPGPAPRRAPGSPGAGIERPATQEAHPRGQVTCLIGTRLGRAAAERLGEPRIATLDRRHLGVVRSRLGVLVLLP
jgi:hypothetical protein